MGRLRLRQPGTRTRFLFILGVVTFNVLVFYIAYRDNRPPLFRLEYDSNERTRSAAERYHGRDRQFPSSTMTSQVDKVIVVGRLASENTDWVVRELSDWKNAIYIVDDLNATLHTPANRGKEAMVYLSYIIDNYDNLSSIIAFVHSHKTGFPAAWHTDNEDHNNVRALHELQIPYVQEQGYVNLRCNTDPGCPDEVQLTRLDPTRDVEVAMPDAWSQIMGDVEPPEVIGTPCCAQFAVTKEQVLRRPLRDYRHFRQWLLRTDLDDDVSGRIFEYLWHIIFGKDPVHCPVQSQCYFDVYGRYF